MKFSSILLKNMVPEWIKLYLSYKLLKNYLSNCSKVRKKLRKIKVNQCCPTYQKIKKDLLKDENVRQLLTEDNQLFINQLKQEMQKIETFLFFKYQDLQTKMKRIAQQLKIMKYLRELSEFSNFSETNINLSYNSSILKETCFNLFIELQQYQSYIYFNYTGIIKILKKYRKFMLKPIIDLQKKEQQEEFTQIAETINHLQQFPAIVSKMSTTIEKLMTNHFYQLNPEKCRYNLRKYSQKKAVKSELYFKFGFFIGFTLVMVALILYFRYEGYIDPDSADVPNVFSKVFPCFRGIALFFVYYWFIGLDLWGWNTYRINYKTYLGFNHHFSTVGEVFRRTSYLSFIFLVVFLFYILQVEYLGIFSYQTEFNFGIQFLPTQYLPLIIWGIAGFYVFVPTFKHLNGAGRLWMYKMMYGATIGHFFKYESRFTFFLDQFTSMGVPMRDLDYTICYYYTLITTNEEHSGECYYQKRITSALVVIIPYTIKCIHYLTRARDKGKFWNTDEMWNFFKTILIVIVGVLSFLQKQFSVFRYIWIPVALSCSCIQYWWDLNKDWLFFEKGTKVKFLRNDLGYDKPYIYYLIAVLNLFLRLTWVLSISPDMYRHLGIKNQELFIFCVGLLEMSRRLINNFIKIEKEYITNLRSLKTTGDFKYPFDEKYLDDELFKFTRHSNSIQEEDSLSLCSGLKEKEERMSLSYLNSNNYAALMSVEVDEKILLMAKKEEKFQISKIKALKANKQTFQNVFIFILYLVIRLTQSLNFMSLMQFIYILYFIMKYRKLLVPEWQKLYIEYQGLKQCLIVTKQVQIRIKEAKMQNERTYDTVREQFINNYDLIKKLKSDNQRFIALINQEIQILETFILFKYQDLKNKIQLLQNQGAKMKSEYVNIEDMHKQSIQSLSIKSNILQESFYEYYNQALQLQRYLYVNRMLLQTIIVKYHKYTFKEIKNIDCIQTSQLMMDVEILSKIEYKVKSLISQVSNLLIVYFYPFDQHHGLNSLLKYKQFKKTKDKTSFLIGLFAGVGIIVISLIMMLRYQGLLDPKEDKVFSPLFPCFRGVGLFILYYWLLTIDQIMWTQYQINYRLFLGFNHHFSTVPNVLKRVSFFSALYLILFLIYCFQVENITATFNIFSGFSEYFPLILWILLLGYVLIPTKSSFNGKGKKWMFKMFYGALIYHVIQYEGRYTFVLDQFVSLWTPLRDLEYTICYYYSHWSYNNQDYNDYQHCYKQQRIVSDICMISVFSLKCLHCLSLARKNKKFYKTNEMWNFLKNSLAVSVGFLSFLTKIDKMSAYIWMLFATTFTLVQYWWELNKDWLFFEKDSKIKFLRNDLGYHNPKIYYVLAVINLFVSSTWALTVTPAMYEYFHITNSEIFIFILGAMELMRRFIHNLFKVEKEHICNIRNFKASKEIIFPFEVSLDVSGLKIRNFRLSGDAGSLRTSLAYDFRRISMDQQQTKSIPNRMTNITAEQLKQLDKLLAQPYDIMLIQEISKKQRISGDLQNQNDRFVQLIKQI